MAKSFKVITICCICLFAILTVSIPDMVYGYCYFSCPVNCYNYEGSCDSCWLTPETCTEVWWEAQQSGYNALKVRNLNISIPYPPYCHWYGRFWLVGSTPCGNGYCNYTYCRHPFGYCPEVNSSCGSCESPKSRDCNACSVDGNNEFVCSSCPCVCPGSCTSPKTMNQETCECECPGSCTSPKVMNQETCECVCPGSCTSPKVMNQQTCECECPVVLVNRCTAPEILNDETCECLAWNSEGYKQEYFQFGVKKGVKAIGGGGYEKRDN